jgi:hypothetical protein
MTMLKRAVLSLLLLAGLAIPIAAQVPGAAATIVMRSGDRISADVIDIAGPGLLIRQNGQERSIPPAEVAQIDFAGDGRSSAGLGGQPRVLLRNGQTVDGRLTDIGGNQPKILYVDTPSGQRQFNSDEVALVVLNPTGANASADRGAAAGGTNRVTGTAGTLGRRQTTAFTIPGNQQWTETDVNVRDGETLELRTTGEIEYAPNVKVSAAGAPRRTPGGPDVPMPNAPAGALIGRVDNGAPFLIGRNTSVRVPASGTLFLGINDDTVSDNSGSYRIIIAR